MPDLEYDDYNKAGLAKAKKFVESGNKIGMDFEALVEIIGCVCTDGAGNYSGCNIGFQGLLSKAQKI